MSESRERKTKIGISIGDVNGIGIEVVLKALKYSRITNLFTPIIYASGKVISYYRNLLDLEFHYFQAHIIEQTNAKKTNVLNVWNEEIIVKPGEENSDGGKYAILSLQAAVGDLKSGKIDALVTAPINKDLMKNEGFDFPGHTEYITKENDRWDLISYQHYGTPNLYEEIIKSNSQVNPTPILASGIKLKIPVLEINSNVQFDLPPWRE